MEQQSWRQKLKQWVATEGNSSTIPDDLRAVREEFVQKFPPKKLRNLTLEQYALGHDKSKDSFSYWLEFGTPGLGMMRGPADKSGVYWRKETEKWEFNENFTSAKNALQSVTEGLAKMIEKSAKKDFADLDVTAQSYLGPKNEPDSL